MKIALQALAMENHSVIKSFTDDWVTAQVTLGHLIGPPHQQMEGEAGWAGLPHCADLGQMPALEWHHHEDIGIGIPAPFTAGLRSKQNDLLRGKPLHQLPREGGRQALACFGAVRRYRWCRGRLWVAWPRNNRPQKNSLAAQADKGAGCASVSLKIHSTKLEIRETPAYAAWFSALRDRTAKARIDIRIRRLSLGNSGDTYVILLAGGDKSSQAQDIRLAKDLAQNL